MKLPPKVKEYWNIYQPKIKPYLDKVKGNKILILPVIIVFLVVFTIILSISQSVKQKKAGQNTIISPQETIVPVPTGPTIISRAGIFKSVKYGSRLEYFIVLKNGDALKLEIPGTIDAKTFYNKNVFVSGILNQDKSLFKVENITIYESGDESPEPLATPVPYPNTSPSPTPTDLPLSSPINE